MDNSVTYILTVILLICVIFFVLLLHKKQQRIATLEFNHAIEQENNLVLESTLELLRKERHEYKNQLQTILGITAYAKEDSCSKIKIYIEGITGEKGFAPIEFNTGSIYINAILAIKKQLAEQNGIRFQTDFRASLLNLLTHEKEMVGVFGNIIDNALEAFENSEKEDKKISIQSQNAGEDLRILFHNNGPQIRANVITEIFKTNFTTKSGSKMDRGYGLSNVKSIIEDIGGVINVESAEHLTTFQVLFPGKAADYIHHRQIL